MEPSNLEMEIIDAFRRQEPPPIWELAAEDTFVDSDFVEAVKARTWQELRPLQQFILDDSDLRSLSPTAYQYYLPAYLIAILDPSQRIRYLMGVLDSLWREGLYFNTPFDVERWKTRMPILTDNQKRAIAHVLMYLLNQSKEDCELQGAEAGRLEKMVNQYWREFA